MNISDVLRQFISLFIGFICGSRLLIFVITKKTAVHLLLLERVLIVERNIIVSFGNDVKIVLQWPRPTRTKKKGFCEDFLTNQWQILNFYKLKHGRKRCTFRKKKNQIQETAANEAKMR